MPAADASLIVVSWNSARELPGLYDSVRAWLGPGPEVIVVDNASCDDSAAIAADFGGRVKVIELDSNRGYGAACNVGVRAASGEVLAIMNPDLLLVDGSLAGMIELARGRRAIVGPRLLSEDRTVQISAFPRVASWELAALTVWPPPLMPARIRDRCEPWRSTRRLNVGWLSGACIVARRDLLQALGPFDERLHIYGEDIDLCLRAHRAGAETLSAPDVAQVVHLGHRSAGRRYQDFGQRTKITTRGWVIREHFGAPAAAYDWLMQLAMQVTRLVVKTFLRRNAAFERSYIQAALTRPVAIRRRGQLASLDDVSEMADE